MNWNKIWTPDGKRRTGWLLASGFWLLASQCAQIVPPSGGKPDKTPPRAVKYIPDSAATNFSAKNIAIAFDEYIQVSDLQKQLVISPPMNVLPEVQVKGRLMMIEIKDSLRENTTYTMNFGSAIRDFTEGNSHEDFQYIFSTGPYIDSLKLAGTVKNALDNKMEKDVLVMLYESAGDSLPYKKLPSYFARTNASGAFKINNIRKGTYKAFALKDANANYLYDSPEELIGFPDGPVKIEKNSALDLHIFKESPAKQKIKKAFFAEHGHIVFAFAKPVRDSVTLNFLSVKPKTNVLYEYSKEKDTLHYWFSDDIKDTLKIRVAEGKEILDTVRLRPIALDQTGGGGRGVQWGLVVKTNVSMDKLFDLNRDIRLNFNHPVKAENFLAIQIREDSLVISGRPLYNPAAAPGSYICGEATIREVVYGKCIEHPLEGKPGEMTPLTVGSMNWKESAAVQVLISPGTFTDIFGLKNDTIKLFFRTQEEKFYGTFRLSLKVNTDKKYILQLLGEKGEVFEPASADKGIFQYNYLPPGPCKLRIIYDENGDGKWTTGNYLQKRKPETVVYYPGDVTIRSNWDLEVEWKVE